MERIKEIFKKDAFAKLCGIQITTCRPGFAECTMHVTENHVNSIGTLMGGALFTLADFTFCVAANSHGTLAVSMQASISYLRPCSRGTVTAIATEISRSSRTGCITSPSPTSMESKLPMSPEHAILRNRRTPLYQERTS
jgi:acyl-CoA thioesterase